MVMFWWDFCLPFLFTSASCLPSSWARVLGRAQVSANCWMELPQAAALQGTCRTVWAETQDGFPAGPWAATGAWCCSAFPHVGLYWSGGEWAGIGQAERTAWESKHSRTQPSLGISRRMLNPLVCFTQVPVDTWAPRRQKTRTDVSNQTGLGQQGVTEDVSYWHRGMPRLSDHKTTKNWIISCPLAMRLIW